MSRLDGNDPVSTAFDAFVLDQDVLAIFILINPKSKFSCFFSHNDKFTEFTKKKLFICLTYVMWGIMFNLSLAYYWCIVLLCKCQQNWLLKGKSLEFSHIRRILRLRKRAKDDNKRLTNDFSSTVQHTRC